MKYLFFVLSVLFVTACSQIAEPIEVIGEDPIFTDSSIDNASLSLAATVEVLDNLKELSSLQKADDLSNVGLTRLEFSVFSYCAAF